MSVFQRLRIKITHMHTLIYILSTRGCSVASVMSSSAALWTIALQAPRSMWFSRQDYWSGLPANPCLLHCRWILYCWATREAPHWAQFLSKCLQTFCRKVILKFVWKGKKPQIAKQSWNIMTNWRTY